MKESSGALAEAVGAPHTHDEGGELAETVRAAAHLLRRGCLAVMCCGVAAGCAASVATFARCVPLILEAERDEGGGCGDDADCDDAGDDGAWMPPTRSARHVCTFASNVWVGCGFAALALGLALSWGEPLGARKGLTNVGLVGFCAVQLAPAIALPPELPGMKAAGLTRRQAWWLGQVAATLIAAALALWTPTSTVDSSSGGGGAGHDRDHQDGNDDEHRVSPHESAVFSVEPWARRLWARRLARLTLAAVIFAAPFIAGAPHPKGGPHTYSDVPAELAAEFAISALVATLSFWLVLGASVGVALGLVDPRLRDHQAQHTHLTTHHELFALTHPTHV